MPSYELTATSNKKILKLDGVLRSILKQIQRLLSGCVLAATPNARAMITTFFIMYWPSKVGTMKDCQVSSGTRTSGEHTISI